MELNIEQFNPTAVELTTLADKYKGLEIKGVDDKEGYLTVSCARKELGKARVDIEKKGKLLRSDALSFQRAVIEKEKELIAIIEPTESALSIMEKAHLLEVEKLKRVKSLPERKERMALYGLFPSDEELLVMDENAFSEFAMYAKEKYLEAQERKQREEQEAAAEKLRLEQEAHAAKMKAEQNKLEADKRKLEEEKLAHEQEKQHQIELEKAKEDAAKKATLEAEWKAKEEKEAEANRVKQEAERIKLEAEAKVKAEQAAKEKLEKQKRWKKFLADNNYTNDKEFMWINEEKKIVLWKKIDEFIL